MPKKLEFQPWIPKTSVRDSYFTSWPRSLMSHYHYRNSFHTKLLRHALTYLIHQPTLHLFMPIFNTGSKLTIQPFNSSSWVFLMTFCTSGLCTVTTRQVLLLKNHQTLLGYTSVKSPSFQSLHLIFWASWNCEWKHKSIQKMLKVENSFSISPQLLVLATLWLYTSTQAR